MDSLRNFLGIFLLLFCILDLDEYSWVLASTNPSQDPKWTSNPSQDLKWTSNSTAENTENKQNRHHTSDANSTAVSSVQDGNINSFMPSLGTVSPKSASLAENSLVLGVDDRETINTTIQTITNFDLDEHSLARLLRALVRQELNECDLFILHDRSFLYSPVMKTLTTLPNSKKIVLLDETVELKGLEWTGRGCSGTLLLMTNPDMFIEYANDALTPWNYKAKVVVVGATKSELEILINTKKARKTESIVGLVKGMKPGHYIIYMNQLYWSSSLAHVTTWMGSSFTTHSQFFPDKISNLKRSKLNVRI
ncbi:hypothetical protein SK128_002881 [Halocaridina rubra]|uniref:PiggyBac transposable element-derived protein domain-containing protein n=1 Tax=Halocaridina rubra TaxID=373956 RepID=A0AAN8WD16_HALRR